MKIIDWYKKRKAKQEAEVAAWNAATQIKCTYEEAQKAKDALEAAEKKFIVHVDYSFQPDDIKQPHEIGEGYYHWNVYESWPLYQLAHEEYCKRFWAMKKRIVAGEVVTTRQKREAQKQQELLNKAAVLGR